MRWKNGARLRTRNLENSYLGAPLYVEKQDCQSLAYWTWGDNRKASINRLQSTEVWGTSCLKQPQTLGQSRLSDRWQSHQTVWQACHQLPNWWCCHLLTPDILTEHIVTGAIQRLTCISLSRKWIEKNVPLTLNLSHLNWLYFRHLISFPLSSKSRRGLACVNIPQRTACTDSVSDAPGRREESGIVFICLDRQ